MSFKPTAEQYQAIYTRGCNLLVSASAGSGKTGVLTQRVLTLITEGANLDELLILTFTRAAAGEMRSRIREALFAAIDEALGEAERVRLRRQITLLGAAPIMTIDAYCMQLLRTYYQAVEGLDPKFRVIDPAQAAIYRDDLLKEYIEGCYALPDPESRANFCELVRVYGTGLSDQGLRDQLVSLIDFGCKRGDLANWLEEMLRRFGDFDFWYALALDEGRRGLDQIILRLQELLKMTAMPAAPTAYGDTLTADIAAIKALRDAGDWDEIGRAKPFATLKRKDKSCDPQLAEFIKTQRSDEIKKKLFEKRVQPIFARNFSEYAADISAVQPLMSALCHHALEFYKLFQNFKLKKSALEFSDLAIFARQLLCTHPELSAALRQNFREVLVDEYQDINPLQEDLISRLAGKQNLFVVGDVKQSIYRFRFADHTLFRERAANYAAHEELGRQVLLNRNFRSRRPILDCVNFFFSQWMDEKTGDLPYGEEEALLAAADYAPWDNDEVELLLVAKNEKDGQNDEKLTLEGRVVVRRIEELIESGVTVGSRGRERPLTYGDIAILTRKNRQGDAIAFELQNRGIPVHTSERDDFIDSQEVRLLLSLLAVLDNPCQDIELAAVLRSPLFGFDENELLMISRRPPRQRLWTRLRSGMVEGVDAEKIQNCVDTLERWRQTARYYPVGDLIQMLLAETDHSAFWGGLPDGRRRLDHIHTLERKAQAFQEEEGGGLFDFLRFIRRLGEQQVGGGEVTEVGNSVAMMTIHKSKGLEFPVVFLVGLEGLFNRTSLNAPLLLHGRLGFGPKRVDWEWHTVANTLPRLLIRNAEERAAFSENLRLLYVAMTRAREKLIMVGYGTEETLDKLKNRAFAHTNGKLPFNMLMGAKSSYLEWLCFGLASYDEQQYPIENNGSRICVSCLRDNGPLPPRVASAQAPVVGERELARLRRALALRPRPKMQAKISVSDLLRDQDTEYVITPEFLRPDIGRLTAAQRGTAFHRLMEHLPLDRSWDAESLALYKEHLRTTEHLLPALLDCVHDEDVLYFLNSSYGQELRQASVIRRELAFTASFPAFELFGGESQEPVILQGAVDMLYRRRDGGWVLVDYKTGHICGDEIRFLARYGPQLALYGEALKRLYRIELAEKVFYLSAEHRFLTIE